MHKIDHNMTGVNTSNLKILPLYSTLFFFGQVSKKDDRCLIWKIFSVASYSKSLITHFNFWA